MQRDLDFAEDQTVTMSRDRVLVALRINQVEKMIAAQEVAVYEIETAVKNGQLVYVRQGSVLFKAKPHAEVVKQQIAVLKKLEQRLETLKESLSAIELCR